MLQTIGRKMNFDKSQSILPTATEIKEVISNSIQFGSKITQRRSGEQMYIILYWCLAVHPQLSFPIAVSVRLLCPVVC